MSIVTVNPPMQTPRYYWSVPVRVPFARWWQYTLFYPLLELPDMGLQQATDFAKALRILNIGGSEDPLRKSQIQIPIALLLDHATVTHPAVSSLEAS